MPQPYMLQVFSKPTKVDDKVWSQWYTEEHIRDMVYFKAASTGSVYRVIAGPETGSSSEDSSEPLTAGEGGKTYFACYQTEKAHPLKSLEYTTRVRSESELWKKAGLKEDATCFDAGEFQAMDLELIGTLGAAEKEEMAPFLVHIEARKDNGRHLNSWVVNDQADAAKKLKGYRRTLFFRVNDGEAYDASAGSGHVMILNEFDQLTPDDLEKFVETLDHSASEKQVNFQARAMKVMDAEGFGGNVREPLRIS